MACNVYAKLDQGMDSFIRITSYLRRKEISIKAISMQSDNSDNMSLNLTIENENMVRQVVNQMSKLVDVKDIKILQGVN